MAVKLEQPEAMGSEPVVVVAIKNHCVLGRDAGAAHQRFEGFFSQDVATYPILELRLPVETHRAGDVAGVVGFGVHVDLD